MARVLHWNGKDIPPELQELPAGPYLVTEYDERAIALSPEEEQGILDALGSIDRGEGVPWEKVRAHLDERRRR